jgi:hypothetical protein
MKILFALLDLEKTCRSERLFRPLNSQHKSLSTSERSPRSTKINRTIAIHVPTMANLFIGIRSKLRIVTKQIF